MAAQVHIVTKKEKKAKQRASFKIICEGVSEKQFFELCGVFRDSFGCAVVLRNPTPPFDATAIHHVVLYLAGSVLGTHAGKAVIDAAKELFVAYMKYKFLSTSDDEHPRRIKLLLRPQR